MRHLLAVTALVLARPATADVRVEVVVRDEDATRARADRDDGPAPPPAAAPPRSRTRFRLGGEITRDDNGYTPAFATGAAALPLATNLRLVATAGIGRITSYLATRSTQLPLRLGVEASAGAAAIELGGRVLAFHEDTCGAWGSAGSVFGAAKAFLPIGGDKRLVLEVGGHYVATSSPAPCMSASNYTSYGGWSGASIEW